MMAIQLRAAWASADRWRNKWVEAQEEIAAKNAKIAAMELELLSYSRRLDDQLERCIRAADRDSE